LVEVDIVGFERDSIMAISGGVLWVSSRASNGHSDQPLAEIVQSKTKVCECDPFGYEVIRDCKVERIIEVVDDTVMTIEVDSISTSRHPRPRSSRDASGRLGWGY